MTAVARAELTMLARNRVVAVCALLMPLAFAVYLVAMRDTFGGGGPVAALQVVVMAAFGVYITATTTLAGRRQTLFLKRLRSGALPDRAVLAGLLLPVVGVNLAQIVVVLGVVAATGSAPSQVVVVLAAVLAVEAMFLALALATWGVTTSPEHAQVTTVPLFLLTLGAAAWTLLTGVDDLAAVKLALPGGAAAALVSEAWTSGVTAACALLLLGPTLGWAAVGLLVTRATLRWEPRS